MFRVALLVGYDEEIDSVMLSGPADNNGNSSSQVAGAWEKSDHMARLAVLYSLQRSGQEIGTWRHAGKLERAIFIGARAGSKRVRAYQREIISMHTAKREFRRIE